MPNYTDEACVVLSIPETCVVPLPEVEASQSSEDGYRQRGTHCGAQVADRTQGALVQQVPAVQHDSLELPMIPSESPDLPPEATPPMPPQLPDHVLEADMQEYPPTAAVSTLVSVEMRPKGWLDVDLVREGEQWSNLGMIVSPNASNPDNLTIDEIDEHSLLGEWNRKRERALQVWPGDVIIAVNGRSGQDLIREIQRLSDKGSKVQLLMRRSA